MSILAVMTMPCDTPLLTINKTAVFMDFNKFEFYLLNFHFTEKENTIQLLLNIEIKTHSILFLLV